jgi:hypothetical protein
MLSIRTIIASTLLVLLVLLALANAIPHAHQSAPNEHDDFWAKKPMHTTDLMAGKAKTATKASATHTQTPTTTPKLQTLYEELDEL